MKILERGKHIMLDIETMSHVPGGAIISIAAVVFDENGICKTQSYTKFSQYINLDSCLAVGMMPSAGTIAWWMQQEPGVTRTTAARLENGLPIHTVLQNLADFYKQEAPRACVWGNGADFDNSFVNAAYRRCKMQPPWAPFVGRCFRTVKNIAKINGIQLPFTPEVAHDPWYDAEAQAKNLAFIHQSLQ
jgi:DNA polymerase III epsilon subunit-like protein